MACCHMICGGCMVEREREALDPVKVTMEWAETVARNAPLQQRSKAARLAAAQALLRRMQPLGCGRWGLANLTGGGTKT
jgi:hypothetical protein